jgi:flagellar motor switch protein FliN/FliY
MAGAQAEIDALLAEVQAQNQGVLDVPGAGTAGAGEAATESDAGPAARMAPAGLGRILQIRVPLMVVLARRKMPVREILSICIGSIIEFDKPSDEELELLVNNRSIAFGHAVKVGENFGLRVMRIHDVRSRIDALRSDA